MSLSEQAAVHLMGDERMLGERPFPTAWHYIEFMLRKQYPESNPQDIWDAMTGSERRVFKCEGGLHDLDPETGKCVGCGTTEKGPYQEL